MRANNAYLFSILILTCSLSCNQNQAPEKVDPGIIENPATASGTEKAEQPVFEFESTTHHFGEIRQGEVVNHTFTFKNAGNKDLFIISAKASCGCTVPSYSKDAVPPGQEGRIEVSFDSGGKTGMVSKTVTLIANTVPNTKVLTISAEIITKK